MEIEIKEGNIETRHFYSFRKNNYLSKKWLYEIGTIELN